MRKIWILGLVAVVGGGPVQARELVSSDAYPANTPTVQALAYMGTLIEQQTNGRYKMRPSAYSDRDSENYVVAQVRSGTLDMARVNLAVLNETAPSTVVVSAPYLFKSGDALRQVLDGPIGHELLADLEPYGLVGLCFFDVGPRSLFTTEKPVKSPADLKGMRVHSQPGNFSKYLWQALGAEPIAVPHSQLSEALRTKVVDAATDNWLSFVAGGHYRFARYLTPTEHARTPGVLIFSLKVWQELDENDRKIIRAAAKEAAVRERQLMESYTPQARRTVQENGVTIVEDVDLNAFRAAMTEIYQSVFIDPRQQNLLQRIQAAVPKN